MSKKRFRLRLGNLLQKGPSTIHEIDAIGNSYVVAATSLFWHCNSFKNFRSCRIYCDACGDDDSGYLNPLARLASWDRQIDIESTTVDWPSVSVELLKLPMECSDLQRKIKELQTQLDSAKFVYYGLPTRRNFGDTKLDSSGHLKVETSAGWQSIAREFWISEVPEFANVFDAIESAVRAIGESADLTRWVERYKQSPEQIAESSSWEWNYQTPNAG